MTGEPYSLTACGCRWCHRAVLDGVRVRQPGPQFVAMLRRRGDDISPAMVRAVVDAYHLGLMHGRSDAARPPVLPPSNN